MIVADTGAILALIDRSDRHHRTLLGLYDEQPNEWILPWAVLPEVDYLLGAHVGSGAQAAFHADLADGTFQVAWGDDATLSQAMAFARQYRSLKIGLVDAVVMATSARLKAGAIATLDVKHFAAVKIPGSPRLFPRDL